jgi:exopolysaccharide production protein ExoQ
MPVRLWSAVMDNNFGIEAVSGTGTDREETRVSAYVVTYAVMFILIFFAMGGYLPVSGTRGSSLGATVSSSDTVAGQVFQLGTWAIALVLMVRHFREIVETCLEMKAMVLLSLMAPLSAVWSQDPSSSVRRGVFLFLGTIFAFYLVRRFSAIDLGQVLVITGVYAGVIGILVSVLLPQFGRDTFNGGAWQGIFRSKNGCAQVMIFFTTAAVSLRFTSQKMNRMRYCLFGITAFLIVMSRAKTSWLLTPIYLLHAGVSSWLAKINRRDAMVMILSSSILIFVVAVSVPYVLPIILDVLGKDASLSGRVPLWQSTIISAAKRPLLGYGYAAFWRGMQGESLIIFLTIHFEIYQAQNGIIELWLELGAVGVFLMAVTFVSALRDAISCLQRGPSPAANWYIGLIVLTIVYNIDETFLLSVHSVPWLMYIIACAGLAAEANKSRNGPGWRDLAPKSLTASLRVSGILHFLPTR